jgi:site-specific DNA recombinase
MSPSFSSKNGVRYRFYVSSALLRGRKTEVGSVGRVPAAEIESTVLATLKTYQNPKESYNRPATILVRVVVARDQLLITTVDTGDGDNTTQEIGIGWTTKTRDPAAKVEANAVPEGAHNESLIQSIVRAYAWMHSLREGAHISIEALAEANRLHPKVVRQALRLAFLSPEVTSAILNGSQPAALSLARVPKLLPLSWTEHQSLLS